MPWSSSVAFANAAAGLYGVAADELVDVLETRVLALNRRRRGDRCVTATQAPSCGAAAEGGAL
jgi:hypothetical protein